MLGGHPMLNGTSTMHEDQALASAHSSVDVSESTENVEVTQLPKTAGPNFYPKTGTLTMEDPQLKDSMDPSKMPFDGKRMFWGGFETIIGLAAGH